MFSTQFTRWAVQNLDTRGEKHSEDLKDSGCTVDMIVNRNLVPDGFELNLALGDLTIE